MVADYKTATILDTLQVGLTVRGSGLLLNPITVRLSPDEAKELAQDLIVRAKEVQNHIDKRVHFVR